MPDLPTGTVTFLFTDIEGSTQLWERYPTAMKIALARHDELLRQTIEANAGYVFKTVGDAFCAAFPTASAALLAALMAQRAFDKETWGETGPLRVRMALHVGAAEERDGDYFGPPLNRVARLLSAGHGGQILLSAAVQELIRDQLPTEIVLRDMGEHRLKDLVRPEHVFQIIVPDLPDDFPPLKSLDVLPNNLPIQLTSFIGREKEMAEVKQLLLTARLLTLTGSGGTGKTRLSLQVAAEVLDDFANGVWLVELASLSDPALVPQAVTSTLGVREEPNRPLLATLTDYLRARQVLLILDNCEHLIEVCAQLADTLLHACPNLHILASSREALGIAGETTFNVPSLSLPDPKHLPPAGAEFVPALTQYEAVQLFIERALSALPGFTVTNQNAPAVAQICYRLDGIPLAIELAAARVKMLHVEQIAIRLDDRFRLLTGGSRTALPRQQTLRALIDWSWDLLSEVAGALLRRLSVFAGGWTLEAAETICQDEGWSEALQSSSFVLHPFEVLDLLTQLANKSLVMVEREQGEEARYRLLETIRQYARDKLLEAKEGEQVRQQHLDYFLRLAERAEPELRGPDQKAWLNRLELEHDNLRAALEWSMNSDAEAGLRLAGALWRFWDIRGYLGEGREWSSQILALPGASSCTIERANVLYGAGVLAYSQSDYAAARALYEESLTIQRELGALGRKGVADALHGLGNLALRQDDYAEARSLHEESLAIRRELEDRQGIADSLLDLGRVARNQHDWASVHSLFAESLTMQRQCGNKRGIAAALYQLGNVAARRGDLTLARSLCEESLAIQEELEDRQGIADTLNHLGSIATEQGDYMLAHLLLARSLAIELELGDNLEIVHVFTSIGELARLQGDYERARIFYEKSLALSRELGSQGFTAINLLNMGYVEKHQGEYGRATDLFKEYLILYRELGGRDSTATSLAGLGGVAGLQRQPVRAARLLGAAEALLEAANDYLAPADRAEYERDVAAARAQLDEATFAAARAEGRAMTIEQAVAYALEDSA
jgi:predicted ATPase/class 3 adenylate cyclase